MKTVLLNHGLASVTEALRLLRTGRRLGEFRLVAARPAHVRLGAGAEAEVVLPEPGKLAPEAYVQQLLSWCAQYEVTVFWPQFWLKTVLRHQAEFAAQGVRLLLPCPDLATWQLLQDKAQVYRAVQPHLPPAWLPDWRGVTDAAGFATALRELESRHERLCIKPTVGVYGGGFRILDRLRTPVSRWLANDTLHARPEEVSAWLAQTPTACLLLEYLPGAERSIDCLAWQGELVTAVVRRKASPAPWQLVEDHPESLELARQLCRQFQLNGVINIQTRERLGPDGRMQPVLLEINPRMSGGVGMSSAAYNLPLAAVRLALGQALDLPLVRTGLQVRLAETVTVAG